MHKKKYSYRKDPQTELIARHQIWCNRNGIFIYFNPRDWREGNIVVEGDGPRRVSEEIYLQPRKVRGKLQAWKKKDIKWWEVVPTLYTEIYNEHTGRN